MTTQNLFEKYGIKEVADVTFYRIEKKEETYEAQREISVGSILKGAIELQDVYPLTEDGVGAEEGFKAYVFKDAELIRGANYDCDDIRLVKEVYTVVFETKDHDLDNFTEQGHEELEKAYEEFNGLNSHNQKEIQLDQKDQIISFSRKQYDPEIGMELVDSDLKGYSYCKVPVGTTYQNTKNTPTVRLIEKYDTFDKEEGNPAKVFVAKYSARYTVFTIYKNDIELSTGVFKADTGLQNLGKAPDPNKNPGTHEYTYPEQVCMLFATNQNLISKTGTRYQFKEADTLFGDIDFNDNFAIAPFSSERIVVVGIADNMTDGLYDVDEVMEKINQLTDTFLAKAFDVTYGEYAELVVEDEMGYFNPAFLGTNYKRTHGNGAIDFFKPTVRDDAPVGIEVNGENTYKTWAASRKGIDTAIALADMWDEGIHYSINDAIDALRQKQKVLDAGIDSGLSGIRSIFGGYKVSWLEKNNKIAVNPGDDDLEPDEHNGSQKRRYYDFKANGEKIEGIESLYPLEDVENAVKEIGLLDKAIDKDLRVDEHGRRSNRAIYIRVDNAVDTSAGSFIYLLHNKNYRRLTLDKDGIFEFEDKKGNTLYYQDLIFRGVEWLALVVIGNKGLIFVVNRHGKGGVERVAWMINEGGYVTDNQAKRLAENGLIHTTDITVNNETFQATCAVKNLKVHRTLKQVNRYVPVLFLDALKVSTIEQTAEEVYATGGHGNANLIGWDYGKEITLSLEDALFTPASMSAMFGSYEGNDFRNGVKDAKMIDRFEKVVAKRSFIVPAGNMNGTPTEANRTAQAVFYDPKTMEPYADGTPIAEGELFYKYTRSVAYDGQSIGKLIEISADKFPGTYKVVGDTFVRSKETGEDERFQFIIPQAKMKSEQTITLEAEGDPTVFNMDMTVLRPEDGVMVKFIQYNVVENKEENDGSTMVKDTENLNLLDDAELFKISDDKTDDETFIGATEY